MFSLGLGDIVVYIYIYAHTLYICIFRTMYTLHALPSHFGFKNWRSGPINGLFERMFETEAGPLFLNGVGPLSSSNLFFGWK